MFALHERPNQPDTAALTASMSFSAGLSVSPDCFAILFRDSSGAEMAFRQVDFHPESVPFKLGANGKVGL